MCRKEKGDVYASNTLIHSVVELFTCKHGNYFIINYVETIKVKNDVVATQYGDDWLPSVYKDATIG